VTSVPMTVPRRHRTVARSAVKARPIRSREEARAAIGSSRHDRTLGVACLIACPAISGLFVGFVALLCVYPTRGGHAFVVGSLVGAVAFAANAIAICLTASSVHLHALRELEDLTTCNGPPSGQC
jgi:hypothetical protein